MSLVPYKVTALKRSDIDGLNIMPGAIVSVFDQGSEYAVLYTDESGETEIGNPFGTDFYGEREFWINPGIYNINIAGGQQYSISIGGAFFVQIVNDASSEYSLDAADIGTVRILTESGNISVPPGVGAPGYTWAFTNGGSDISLFDAGEDVNIIPNAGGTPAIPPNGTVSIMCTASNPYRLIGQTVAE